MSKKKKLIKKKSTKLLVKVYIKESAKPFPDPDDLVKPKKALTGLTIIMASAQGNAMY